MFAHPFANTHVYDRKQTPNTENTLILELNGYAPELLA